MATKQKHVTGHLRREATSWLLDRKNELERTLRQSMEANETALACLEDGQEADGEAGDALRESIQASKEVLQK